MHVPRRRAFLIPVIAAIAASIPAAALATTAQTASPGRGASPVVRQPAAPQLVGFSGTVALDNCSGAIVRWKGSADSDQAMMLTSGRCYDSMGSRVVVVNKPQSRSVTLLNSDSTVAGTVHTTSLLYATMYTTDVALYQLHQTYAQLQSTYGVPSFTLGNRRPDARHFNDILILSGFQRKSYVGCDLYQFAFRLHEDVWDWNKSLRYSNGCYVVDGAPGSPVLDVRTGVQIGVSNTINQDGSLGEYCSLHNPCEEDRDGDIKVKKDRGYAQQTYLFYGCLSGITLNLNKKGCNLPKP